MEENRKPASAASHILYRALTKQERKRIRDALLDALKGLDPNLARPFADCCVDNCRTTLDVEVLGIFTGKIAAEADAKGCANGEPVGSVITQERALAIWAEAEAEMKKHLN